ncbi:heparinase II/III domain-containing protein [Glutamicibacter sp. 363]|uniref:heparinase II/III domain-containing protein n=1 Tax=Glutamicibacter sp. 363 TaxID=3457731 RepID=UPI00403454EC
MNLDSAEVKTLVDAMTITQAPRELVEAIPDFLHGDTHTIPSLYGQVENEGLQLWEGRADRSEGRYFHAFLFMQGWAKCIAEHHLSDSFEVVQDIFRRWETRFTLAKRQRDEMAYHDETTAQRLTVLVSFIRIAEPQQVPYLRELADRTAGLLATEEFHSGLNNHGMFQDVALRHYALTASWLSPERRDFYWKIACERLSRYFVSAFTPEGVHVENTPTYHLMVSKHLHNHVETIRRVSGAESEILNSLLEKTALYATHITTPDGMFAPIGDTNRTSNKSSVGQIFNDEFSYSVTGGKQGLVPNKKNIIFPKSGYAMYRSDWEDENSTYLLFQAAYNANYHKHSDDLSILLYANGRNLITEAGPYSYNYADPFSIYAYSQYAHNNIVVNEISTPRTDKKSKTVKIDDFLVDDDTFHVAASTGRLTNATHKRTVDVVGAARKETILVKDELSSLKNNRYDAHWNIPAGFRVLLHGNGFEVFDGDTKVLDAFMRSNVPIKMEINSGESNPNPRGWNFPKFGSKAPLNSVCVQIESSGTVLLETEFNIHKFRYKDRGIVGSLTTNDFWGVYKSSRNINYLYDSPQGKSNSTPIVFVFSAMGALGDFTYNYRASLKDVNCHIYYLLDDFGDQGSYYHQEKGNRDIHDSVQAFIADRIKHHGKSSAVYFVGSSKGGSAAMIHGLRVPRSNIFVGAPQTKIGSFLEKPHPNIIEYMTGGVGASDISTLDEILYDAELINRSTNNITVLVGKKDHHFRNHVSPWSEYVSNLGLKPRIVALEGTPHSEIGKIYSAELRSELKKAALKPDLSDNDLRLGSYNIWFDALSSRLFITVESIPGTEVSFRLYRENTLWDSTLYSNVDYYTWNNLPKDIFRIRIFRRVLGNSEAAKGTTHRVDTR